MDNKNRFSILQLEKDVLEYIFYKERYQEIENKIKTCYGYIFKKYYTEKKTKYYLLYINKMKYLEENYRKTKIYTDYHRQLEGPEPVIATAIDPSAPDYAL